MPFTTGTARNQNGLLDAVNTYLQGLSSPWTELAYTPANKEATAVAINAAGTGYVVSDVLTVSGGTGTAAQLTVDSVGGSGEVTGISISIAGSYSAIPSNPVSVTGGTGSGATFNLTMNFIATDIASLSLQAPGNGAGSEVYFNVETESDVGPGFYTWDMYGAVGFQSSIDHSLQQLSSGPCYYNLWQNDIDYWIYANDRRLIIVSKVSSNYMSMYAGFLLPPALPTEYPFPYYLCGSYVGPESPSLNNARNSFIVDPGADGCARYLRRTVDAWRNVENQDSSTSGTAPQTGQRAFVWPHKTGSGSASESIVPSNWGAGGFGSMRLNASDETPLVLAHVVDMLEGTIVGALEGCYSVCGFGRSPEQLVTIGGQDYRLFPKVYRNTAGDFMAIEES